MYCGRCGAEIKDETARFCDNCGAKLEGTSGASDDYGNEDTYNGTSGNDPYHGRMNNRTYHNGGSGNGTYGTYNNGGAGNGTYGGRTNTGMTRNGRQNHREDDFVWDNGVPEVPDNRGDNGERKKWLISIGCTVGIVVITAVILALVLGKNSGGKDSDIVVNITQAPKAEASKDSTQTASAKADQSVKTASAVTPTPAAKESSQELEISGNNNTTSKKNSTVQPSRKSTTSGNSQTKKVQTQPSQSGNSGTQQTQNGNSQTQQTQNGQSQTQQSAEQSQADKDLDALRNAPTQEYVLPEGSTGNTTGTTQSSAAASVSSSAAASTAGSGDYIFPESNSTYLTRDQLEGLSKDQLAYARNEIYARHGRRFRDQMFQDYFNAKSWYVPQYDPDQFDAMQDTIFNDYEKENAKLILEVEKEHGYTY